MQSNIDRNTLVKNISILGVFLASVASVIDILLAGDIPGFIASGTIIILFLAVFLINVRGKTRTASIVFVGGMWLFFTALTMISGGVNTSIFSGQIITILIAGVLLGARASFYTSVASAISAILFVYFRWMGLTTQIIVFEDPAMLAIQYIGLFIAASTTLNVLLKEIDKSRSTLIMALAAETKQKELSKELADEYKDLYKNAQFTQFAIENSADAAYWISKDGKIKYANLAACQMLGYRKSSLMAKSIFDIDGQVDRSEWGEAWERLIQQQSAVKQSTHVRRDGTFVPVEITANYVALDGEEYNCCFARDISKRMAFEKELLHMATHDHLTQLPNRVLLHDRLGRSIEKARRSKELVALLLFDLDGFKRVNDERGHAAGDILLRELARRLLKTLRASDSVARLGGDEFTIIANGVKSDHHIKLVANKVRKAIERPFEIERARYELTASMGIALYPMHGDNADGLLRVADMAMYEAKNNRHPYVIAEPGIVTLEEMH